MNDFVIMGLGLIVCITVAYIVHSIRDAFIKNALLKEAQLLRSQIANARKMLGEFEEEPRNMLADAMGGLGLGGVLQNLNISDDMLKQLGVPSWAMPIAHGFIDKMKAKQGATNVAPQQSQFISQTD